MRTMISEVYDAFIASGAPDSTARKAAEALAALDNRFAAVEARLAGIESDLNMLKWMSSGCLAFSLGIFIKLFLH